MKHVRRQTRVWKRYKAGRISWDAAMDQLLAQGGLTEQGATETLAHRMSPTLRLRRAHKKVAQVMDRGIYALWAFDECFMLRASAERHAGLHRIWV